MKNKFTIVERPLPHPEIDISTDITGLGAALIKRGAKLMNDMEMEKEEAEHWRQELFLELIEVVDSLDRIRSHTTISMQETDTAKLEGHIRAVTRQLSWLLQRREVVPFDTMGKQAAPELTEIIDFEERDNGLDEEVVEEIEKGYTYRGRLLRRAKVKVIRLREE